ncbi:MAG: ElyC/SanA/YdcF family protein [Pontiella sp.]
MKIRFSVQTIRRACLLALFFAAASLPLANLWIRTDTNGTVFFEAESIPSKKVGLVLGCGRNIYFHYRIEAAAKLFKAGKIQHILVSGDHHTATYNEASAMKNALIKQGVPAEQITCDYAGFSTLDSILRAKKVFGLNQLTIISQEFHVRRALFIAKRSNLEAIGFCAKAVETSIGAPTQRREAFARVKTVLDLYLLNRQPRFLGEPISIQPEPRSPALFSADKA